MYHVRKILVMLFIVSACTSQIQICYSADTRSRVQSNDSDIDYDAFDAMADDMVDRGVVQDELKPLSTFDRWAQSICSPIIMKYVLLKGYLREWGYWILGVKKN